MTREELLKVAKPILFNTEMVQAILDGRKTVTRRAIDIDIVSGCDIDTDGKLLDCQDCYGDFTPPEKLCRYQPGDILYVRETWKYYEKRVGYGENCHLQRFIAFKADDGRINVPSEWYEGKWHPSIHMPKEDARIFLKVTGVRVERLQDMTDDDAYYEGIDVPLVQDILGERCWEYPPLDDFIDLWDSAIKKSDLAKYGWKANPYVWVIEFNRIEPKK